ncbi:MAG: acyl-CoA dehydrogenase family protein [Verrucomicrobiota bacterium]
MKTIPPDKTPKSVIDTSKMSEGERAALELAESSRDLTSNRNTFAGTLFFGRPDFNLIHPFPAQSLEDRDQGDAFLQRLEAFLDIQVNPDEIDRTGEIPDAVITGLAKLGAFGIKIPTQYGGLGLSQTNYSRAAMLLGSTCGNLAALLSAHQSIGVPQPLLLFGTPEQKKMFLPRCAAGEISAFALTEPEVGSDPARIKTTAVPSKDGRSWIINGQKLWCTNGLKAGLIVVMAKTPSPEGDKRTRTTAFIVDTRTPGVTIANRCRFMGLRALYNGIIKFKDVRVPADNIILAEGKGLKVALTTLNTGRLTLPAACTGLANRCLDISLNWAKEREQWGAPIGKHAAIADKIARMRADTFTMESMVFYTSALVDRDKHADIRIEAAIAKMLGSEAAWRIADDTMQIRGGRGYETAESLQARGEKPIPVERFLRDARINTIFEGSSEIMRLFIAREALDPHLKIGAPVLNSTLPFKTRAAAALKATWFYARWYPKQWLPLPLRYNRPLHHEFRKELRHVNRLSRKLARSLFHAMLRFGPKLDKQQLLLGRFVEIGAHLFALTAAVARAQYLLEAPGKHNEAELIDLVTYIGRRSRRRIKNRFQALHKNEDQQSYHLTQSLLK